MLSVISEFCHRLRAVSRSCLNRVTILPSYVFAISYLYWNA